MKNIKVLVISALFIMLFSVNLFAVDTHSGKAVEEAFKASGHASGSAAHSIAGSGQVTSAASAIPLAIGGSVGAVSTEIAKELINAATAPVGAPLEISDESVTAGPPPDQALATKKPKQE
jgi:hypothetical protein